MFESFQCDVESVLPFVLEVRSGSSPKAAFEKHEGELAIGKEGKRILNNLFSALGTGYKDGTLSHIRSARDELERYTAGEKEEAEKNSKLITALLVGGAVGVLLLFL